MSTRQERLRRHQAAEEARQRLQSGAYNQPQQPYKSTRMRALEEYNQKQAPPPSSFSGDPQTSMLNVPNAIQDFQTNMSQRSVQPDFLKLQPAAGSLQAIQHFMDTAPPPHKQTRQEWIEEQAANRERQLQGAPDIVKAIDRAIGKGIDYAQAYTPGLADFQQGAGRTLGVEAQTAPPTGGIVGGIARGAGAIIGGAVNPAALEQSVATGGERLATGIAQRYMPKAAPLAQRAVGSSLEGAAQNTALTAAVGNTDPRQLAEAALFGGAGGAAFEGVGAAINKGVRTLRERPLTKEIEAFVQRTSETPEGQAPFPTARNERQLIGSSVDRGAEPANAFNRFEKIQQQYDEAIEAHYQFLKKSMKERGGVQQGGVIKDPTTGEVIDRYGRTSSNPRWYRDFYAENGRKPADKDLRNLARKQVNEGYLDDDAGTVPPWKPRDIEDIDGEMSSIREMLQTADDPADRAALEQVAATLQDGRQQVVRQIPEGVRVNDTGTVSAGRSSQRQVVAAPKEPTNLDDLVKYHGHGESTPETIAQSYNNKTWYHGTGKADLKAEQLDPFLGNHESLFGQGIYLTDSPEIAGGYAKNRGKRTGTPTIYETKVGVDRVLDLEKPVQPEVGKVITDTFGQSLDYLAEHLGYDAGHFSKLFREELSKPNVTPESLILSIKNHIRDFSHDEGISTNEFVENFQDLAINLKQLGYDGITHSGGHRTGKDPHRVLILLDPQNNFGGVKGKGAVARFEKVDPTPEANLQQGQLPDGVQAKMNGQARSAVPNPDGQISKSPLPPATAAPEEHALFGRKAQPASGASVGMPVKTISRTALARSFRKNLGVTIDTGRMGVSKNQVAGIYKVKPEVIRTGSQGDYETIAHEVGHHLTKVHDLKSNPALERELTQMMDAQNVHDYKQYPQEQWFDEGIAEYFRTYLADPAQARQIAPLFSAFLDATLPAKVQKGLRAVQRDVKTWIDQGDYHRAQGKLDFESGGKKKRFSWNRWYAAAVDDLHPLALLEKALTGKLAQGKESLYKMARLSRGVAERAKMAVTRGVYDDSGRKLSDGLREIVKPLEEIGMSDKDLSTYLAVKHAADLRKMGKETPFTSNEMADVLNRWDADPTVQKVHQQIMKYNNALLDILQDAGVISKKSVKEMRQKYPNYVPFLRHFDDDEVAGFKEGGFGAAKAFANITTPVRKMSEEGSDRTIINPIESMVKNTFLAMNAAAKNKVGLNLAELAKVDGAGAWVEAVPGQKSAREHIIDVYQDGKKQAYKIRDPELYSAMLSLDHESTNAVIKFLGGAAGMLRGGATLTPEFIIRNAFRDVAGAIINSSKYGFNPFDFFKGLFHVVTKSDVFDKFVNSGGAMSTMMALDRDANREAMEAVFRQSLKDKTMNVVTSPAELAKWLSYRPIQKTIGVLRKGAEISELSTKVGAFNKVLKKTGDIGEAAYTARDLMDFNRAGSSIRQANRAIAFLNASIQGTDKMVRSFWGTGPKDFKTKGRFMSRAATTLVLPALGIYFWNKLRLSDEERAAYENLPRYQKDNFFIIGIPGTGEFVRIPKPFEAGMLFATSAERALDWLHGNDPKAFEDYGRATLQSFTPPMLFTALSPLLEAITNYSFFRDAPIVPQGEQRFEKKDQYGVYTSEVAKDIGRFMDTVGLGNLNFASPRVIDNTISGYFAGLGNYGVDLADAGIKAATGRETTPLPEKRLTEMPVARSFFASTSGGGQVREDFYDKWEKLSKKKESAEFNEEPFEDVKEYARMKPYQKEIAALQKRYKAILQDKNLNSDSKRSQLDLLDDRMNAAAKKALGR